MSITASFEYDPKEWYAASRAVTRSTHWRWTIPLFSVLIPAIGFVLSLDHWDVMTPSARFWSSLPWLLLFLFYIALIPVMQRRRVQRLKTDEPTVRGTQSRTVDETGFHVRGHGFAQDLAWGELHRVVETDRFFLFFYNKRCAHVMPKRVLSSDEVAGARTLIAQRIGERARLQWS